MYQGKYSRDPGSGRKRRRTGVVLLSVLLLVSIAAGGTVAFLFAGTAPVKNTFVPSHVSCQVAEEFDGTTKRNVNVKNTGDTEAYIRVKLVSYRANDAGQHIGGEATLPTFQLGANWVLHTDGCYYYTLPVKPGEKPATNLTDSMTLTPAYEDADGGKQVIEVMAEAIQSSPAEAAGHAWGVRISQGSVTAYSE